MSYRNTFITEYVYGGDEVDLRPLWRTFLREFSGTCDIVGKVYLHGIIKTLGDPEWEVPLQISMALPNLRRMVLSPIRLVVVPEGGPIQEYRIDPFTTEEKENMNAGGGPVTSPTSPPATPGSPETG